LPPYVLALIEAHNNEGESSEVGQNKREIVSPSRLTNTRGEPSDKYYRSTVSRQSELTKDNFSYEDD
jgi:hypothetical protein